VKVLGEGIDHATYLVDGSVVVRVVRGEDAREAARRVERDAELLRIVADLSPIPVPSPTVVSAESAYLAYPLLPGVPLLDLLYGGGDVSALPERSAVARPLGQLVRALSATLRGHVEHVVDDDCATTAEWRDEAQEHYVATRHALAADARLAVEAWLNARPPASSPYRVFAHNDLGIEHVLVDAATFRVTGVIDWSDAAFVDPACDLGRLLRDLGPAAFELVLAASSPRAPAADVVARSWFYARCGVLEDLAFGLETSRPAYVTKSLAAVEWLFVASSDLQVDAL
jgi:aminoglycoside phosphotransferase (APT) family kinase protein